MTASPCQISSKSVKRLRRYGDLMVFKMAVVRHLGFWKINFLTVWAVKRPILHNRAKFREDRSIRYHIAIFVGFSRWRPPPSRFLKDSKFQRSIPCRGPICVTVPNFIKIRQTVAQVWRFNGFFSKWRPSAILDLSGAYWDQPRRLLGGLYRCAKFGWNRCSILSII